MQEIGQRTLPVRVAPERGESLTSYLERLAWAHGLNVAELVECLGVATSKSGGQRISTAPAALDERRVRTIASATGVGADAVEAMLMRPQCDGTALDLAAVDPDSGESVARHKVREWAYFDHSQASPDYLRRAGHVAARVAAPAPVVRSVPGARLFRETRSLWFPGRCGHRPGVTPRVLVL